MSILTLQRYRLTAALFILVAILLTLLLWTLTATMKSTHARLLREREELFVELIAKTCRRALLTNEYDEAQNLADELLPNPQIDRIILADHRNRIVVSTVFAEIGAPFVREKLTAPDWRYLTISTPANTQGTLAVSFSQAELTAVAKDMAINAFLLGLPLLMVFAGLSFLLATLWSRRLECLTVAVQQVAAGNLATRITVTGNDEIARLGQMFNRMTESLQSTFSALTESESRLNDAQQLAHLGNWELNCTNNHFWWSRELYRIGELDPEQFIPTYEAFLALVHPGDQTMVNETYRASVQNKTPLKLTYRLLMPDGRIKFIEVQGITTYDSDGVPLRSMGAALDITELKQADINLHTSLDRLAENEERLRLALMAANQGLYDLNVQTGEAFVSPEYAIMLGYDPAEFHETNAKWLERLHPDDHAPTAQAYQAYIRGETSQYRVEFRQRTKSGDWKWILSIGKIVERDASGNPLRMLGIHADLTNRRRAEEALRVSEERYRKIFTDSAALMLIIDPTDGRIVDINAAACAYYGYTPTQLKAMEINDLNTLSQEQVQDEMTQAREQEKTRFEFRHRLATGELRDVDVSSGPIEIDGRTLLLSIVTDITERKQAAEKIAQNLEEKETLLREIHHRVKNNLAVISGLLDLQSARIQDQTMKWMFEESRQRIKSMALIHEKLYRTADLAHIDFRDYLNSIASDLLASYHVRGREIHTRIDAQEIALDIDSAIPCGLIINELITNALKHAFAARTAGEIAISLKKKADAYTLTVQDDGIGLPEGFDINKVDTLGLKLVTALTRQLRGRVRLQSSPAIRQGTAVIITFSAKF